ncbi:unnamed protein product, partial [Polarella glacialis]
GRSWGRWPMDNAGAAVEGPLKATSAEGSTAAPDTPVSSDYSAPSCGQQGAGFPSANGNFRRSGVATATSNTGRPTSRVVIAPSARMSADKGLRASLEKEVGPDTWGASGTRSVPAPAPHSACRQSGCLASVLLHRPISTTIGHPTVSGSAAPPASSAEGLPRSARSPNRAMYAARGGQITGSWRGGPGVPGPAGSSAASSGMPRSNGRSP